MFTGLVEALGTVRDQTITGAGSRLVIAERAIAPKLRLGESVAVNGVCLTENGPKTTENGNRKRPNTTENGRVAPGVATWEMRNDPTWEIACCAIGPGTILPR